MVFYLQMKPSAKKIRSLKTPKSHFDIILRYFYNKRQVVYRKDIILDLITEGYRFSLDPFVTTLWETFVQIADANMVANVLQRVEKGIEFRHSWDDDYLH